MIQFGESRLLVTRLAITSKVRKQVRWYFQVDAWLLRTTAFGWIVVLQEAGWCLSCHGCITSGCSLLCDLLCLLDAGDTVAVLLEYCIQYCTVKEAKKVWRCECERWGI